jgi:hypothetical protein
MSVTQFSTLSTRDWVDTMLSLGHLLEVDFSHLFLSHKIKEQIVAGKKMPVFQLSSCLGYR